MDAFPTVARSLSRRRVSDRQGLSLGVEDLGPFLEYDRWIAGQKADPLPAIRGAEVHRESKSLRAGGASAREQFGHSCWHSNADAATIRQAAFIPFSLEMSGKRDTPAAMQNLDGRQIQQLVDMKQLFETMLQAEAEHRQRFKGSMSWKHIHGKDYLYRKRTDAWKSLGVRSRETENIYAQFEQGRKQLKARIAALKEQIERMAPVCRAMRLGRMPSISARILRRLDSQGIIGHGLMVVGTNALFAYESLVSAHFESVHVATADIDLLFDASASLKLVAPELKQSGLIGQLQKVDKSFAAPQGSFRAANNQGFLVDLIMAQPRNPSAAPARRRIGEVEDDQSAAEIEGLAWLQNSPTISEIALDERGFPVRMSVPDPRAFAIYKIWLSQRPDRDAGKRRRDRAQAKAVAEMVRVHLPDLPFDEEALLAFPAEVRRKILKVLSESMPSSIGRSSDW